MSSRNRIWFVELLPTAVVPFTPALESPISSVKTMSPSPSPAVEFTSNPPSALVSPIFLLKVTSPVPESIVRVSVPALAASTAPWKVTSPAPPVPVVIATLAPRSTPEVLKAIAVFVEVNVAAPVMSIFPPPVFAV